MPLFVALLLRVLTVVFLRLLGAQAEDKTHGERPLIFGVMDDVLLLFNNICIASCCIANTE